MIKIETDDYVYGGYYILGPKLINGNPCEDNDIIKICKYTGFGDNGFNIIAKAKILPEYIESFWNHNYEKEKEMRGEETPKE